MPIPKVPNGTKLTLMLPEDVVLRIKTEALQKRVQPSDIVQGALGILWGENPSLPSEPAPRRGTATLEIHLTSRQMQKLRGRSLFKLIQSAIAVHLFTEDQLLRDVGVSPSAYLKHWKPGKKVPVAHLDKVVRFLATFKAIRTKLQEALNVPEEA